MCSRLTTKTYASCDVLCIPPVTELLLGKVNGLEGTDESLPLLL